MWSCRGGSAWCRAGRHTAVYAGKLSYGDYTYNATGEHNGNKIMYCYSGPPVFWEPLVCTRNPYYIFVRPLFRGYFVLLPDRQHNKFISNIIILCTVRFGLLGNAHINVYIRNDSRCTPIAPQKYSNHVIYIWHYIWQQHAHNIVNRCDLENSCFRSQHRPRHSMSIVTTNNYTNHNIIHIRHSNLISGLVYLILIMYISLLSTDVYDSVLIASIKRVPTECLSVFLFP